MEEKLTIQSLDELQAAVHAFYTQLPTHNDHATVVGLKGDLGAGKTTFVQTLAKELGVRDTVTSPTFGIMKSYKTTDAKFQTLVHIDAYRIEDTDEMRVLHFDELLATPHTLVCIEWWERIGELMPRDAHLLSFELKGESRTLEIINP